MAYNADGTWNNEDDSVASQVAKLQSKDSAISRNAVAQGMQGANRRGLINSSMGVGAGLASNMAAIVPIASQEAQQNFGKNQSFIEDRRARDISAAQIASNDRSAFAQTSGNIAQSLQTGIAQTLANDKIPSGTRSQVQSDMTSLYQSQMNQLAALYGTTLNWGGSTSGGGTNNIGYANIGAGIYA